jgi:hypothetical protein
VASLLACRVEPAIGSPAMTWTRLDDKFHDNRKVRQAGLEAIGLWSICLSYCGDQLTDGFVPDWYVAGIEPGTKGLKIAHRLVVAGLWQVHKIGSENGWIFHDYLEMNPSRKEVLTRREADRRRKANPPDSEVNGGEGS